MTKTFRSFPNRLDTTLVGFKGSDEAALLQDICTNSATAHVKAGKFGAVSVPAHAASAVADHLTKLGWTAE